MKTHINEVSNVHYSLFQLESMPVSWDSYKKVMTILDLPDPSLFASALRELFSSTNSETYCAIINDDVRIYNLDVTITR